MKNCLFLILLVAGIGRQACAQEALDSRLAEANASGNKTAVKLSTAPAASGDMIAKAVQAYNEKDTEAYIACFSLQVAVYNASGVLMFKGREKLKESFEAFLAANPGAKRKIIERVNSGNRIMEREQLLGVKGQPEQNVTSVYELEDGLIKAFYFIAEL
jgi:hypothetical protein